MMHQPIDMAHVLGSVAKWAVILVAVGFSVALSFMFFQTITPADKPWFSWAALSLTEGGFVLWLAVFMLTHHHPVSKTIALVMTCACALCSLCVAGYEFYLLLATHYDIAQNTGVIQGVSILLEVIFCFHFVALILDLFASYFSRPGNNFRNRGNLIPMRGNLIPNNAVSVQELQAMQNAITGYISAISGGESADPLDFRSMPRPKDSEQESITLAQIGQAAKEAVNSATKRVRNSIRNTSKPANVPGQTNATTSESTSTNEVEQELNSTVE